jgi:hypothetical protein
VPTAKRNRSEEYERRKQKCLLFNICFKCSKPKGNNKWKCDECLDTDRQRDRERRARRASVGLCDCGQPALPNKKRCQACTNKYRLAQADQRAKHKTSGGCITCGRPPIPGLATCVECAARATKSTINRYNSNKQNNLCPFCGGKLDGKFRCGACHKDHLKRGRARWYQQRLLVLEHYGRKCACCGETTYEFLEIDHIDNNGAQHRNLTGRHIIEDIIKKNFPTDLQILCANCNRGKGKFGVCPHKQEPTPPKSKSGINARKRRQRCINHYGGKCISCGEENWAFLEFDHINNDGNEHRKELKGNFVSWLIQNNFPDTIQLLCSNCNKAKGLIQASLL